MLECHAKLREIHDWYGRHWRHCHVAATWRSAYQCIVPLCSQPPKQAHMCRGHFWLWSKEQPPWMHPLMHLDTYLRKCCVKTCTSLREEGPLCERHALALRQALRNGMGYCDAFTLLGAKKPTTFRRGVGAHWRVRPEHDWPMPPRTYEQSRLRFLHGIGEVFEEAQRRPVGSRRVPAFLEEDPHDDR